MGITSSLIDLNDFFIDFPELNESKVKEYSEDLYNKLCFSTKLFDDTPADFLNIVWQIETSTDAHAKAKIAEDYLRTHKEYNLYIEYDMLIKDLKNITEIPSKLCRNYYLIERSIPYKSEHFNWLNRLKIFCNNYLLETAVLKCNDSALPGKLEFKNKNTHYNLFYGQGTFVPDFKVCGSDPEVQLECKSHQSDIADAYIKFKDPNERYFARYVVVFLFSGNCFYIIDYAKNEYKKLNKISIQDNLFNTTEQT